jgi:LuxR family transcriptional regulator, transcriptional regulator of spore coat protein
MAQDQPALIRHEATVAPEDRNHPSPEVNMSMVEMREPEILGQSLTRRERVVLGELSEDVTLEEIAARLFVTRNTVKSQVRSVYRKIGVSTRAEAVAWARKHGLQ